MPDPIDERMKKFEAALDPNVTPFTKNQPVVAPVSALIGDIRECAKGLLKACDELDAMISASESDARKAADLLIAMAARIK